MKKILKIFLGGCFWGALLCLLSGCSDGKQEAYDQLQNEYASLEEVTDQLRSDYDNATQQYDILKQEYDALLVEKQSLEEEYKKYQEEMQPYYEYVINLQNMQVAADQAAYAEQQQQAQMAQLVQSYETGITYEQLMTDPDTYVGQKVKFSGQVLLGNVEGETLTFLLAVDGDLAKLMLFAGSKDWVDAGLTQGSVITVYGTSVGLYDYDTSALAEYYYAEGNQAGAPEANTAAAPVPEASAGTVMAPEASAATPAPEANTGTAPSPEADTVVPQTEQQGNAQTGTVSKIPGVSIEYIV